MLNPVLEDADSDNINMDLDTLCFIFEKTHHGMKIFGRCHPVREGAHRCLIGPVSQDVVGFLCCLIFGCHHLLPNEVKGPGL